MGYTLDQLNRVKGKSIPIATPQTQSMPVEEGRRMGNPLDLAIGAGKGAISTAVSTTNLMQKVGNKVGDAISGLFTDKKAPVQPLASELVPVNLYTPANKLQSVGFGAEQIAEFFIPGTKVAKVQKAVDLMVDGSKLISNPVVKATTKVLGKAATEGVSGAAVTLAQTGDAREARNAGLLFGGTKAVTSLVGEVFRAAKVPEYLYNKVFKNAWKDTLQELRTQGVATLQKTNPAKYAELQKAGIIKVAANGTPKIDPTLAREALDHGLKGSLKNMSNEVVEHMLTVENTVQTIAKNTKKAIAIPETQYRNVLKAIAQDYKDVGFGEAARTASTYAKKLARGRLSVQDALGLRRFLDGLRIQSSYANPAPRLSLSQQNLKTLTDRLRGRLADVPGMGPAMKDYRFYIDALEALAKEATRRGNKEVISLIDSVLFSGGVAAGEPIAAATISFGRRLLNSPSAVTNIGSVIEKGGTATKTGTAVKAGAVEAMSD